MTKLFLLPIIMVSIIFEAFCQDTTSSITKVTRNVLTVSPFNDQNVLNAQYPQAGNGEPGASLFDEAVAKASSNPKVPWYVEKFRVSAGAFVAINNTDIRVSDVSGGLGTNINFENDLGFKKNSWTFLGDFQWRSSSRSRFDLSYIYIGRSSDHTIQQDITFGDNTYAANTQVNAFFNTTIYRFSYGYAILSKPNFEAGLLVGLHIVRASVGLSTAGSAANLNISNDFGFTAPLPDFGVWGGYTFSDRWAVTGEFDYFSLTVDNINGRILGFNALVTYRVIGRLDLSAGYTGLDFNVGVTRPKWNGDFNWGYNGPTLTATYSFGHGSWTH
ncbi:MAG TPA: hypothetical protein VGI43_04220 [Mucilaginibacter sp.]